MEDYKKEIEFCCFTGSPKGVIDSLNRSIGQYKRRYSQVKVGITGRNPQSRFNEHLKVKKWDRMIVIYETSSINFANTIENWLVEYHWNDLINQKEGGNSYLSPEGKNYAYVLLK
jgi:hypothetical protein